MENCPMYSLRSYSIAARSSQLGAVFQMLGIDHKNYGFASLIELFFLASLGLGANIVWSLCSVNLAFRRKGVIVIRERAAQNFDTVQSLVDTRSANPC